MRHVQELTGTRLSRLTPSRVPQRHDRVVARLRADRIDRELAEGVVPWSTVAHAARALQLAGDRSRDELARWLEGVAKRAEEARAPLMNAVISPCREQVREALPLILQLAERLRAEAPVNPRGVAALRRVVSDGSGPCYRHSRPDALVDALADATRWLDVEG